MMSGAQWGFDASLDRQAMPLRLPGKLGDAHAIETTHKSPTRDHSQPAAVCHHRLRSTEAAQTCAGGNTHDTAAIIALAHPGTRSDRWAAL